MDRIKYRVETEHFLPHFTTDHCLNKWGSLTPDFVCVHSTKANVKFENQDGNMIKQGKGLQAYLLEEAEYVSSTDAQTASENPTTPPLPTL